MHAVSDSHSGGDVQTCPATPMTPMSPDDVFASASSCKVNALRPMEAGDPDGVAVTSQNVKDGFIPFASKVGLAQDSASTDP